MSRINLGDEVQDCVTGLKGIVIAKTFWLNGCERILIQAKMDKDGKVPDSYQIDEPQLKVVKKSVIKLGSPDVGGPIDKKTFSSVKKPNR